MARSSALGVQIINASLSNLGTCYNILKLGIIYRMKTLSTSDLDTYVAFVDCDCNGDLNNAKFAEVFLPFNLAYKTAIDESLDPFSDEYFQSQIDLYEEIAGKRLDQWSGELHPVNIAPLLESPNPLGVNKVGFIAEHVRILSSMLSLSCIGSDALVLDMGAGHGVSSETYAFCGCQVHAIDIDPDLSVLATKRANARSLRITRTVMNFDSLTAIQEETYEAAFFFQSLHHALRPWDLIAQLKQKLTHDGVIVFGGEPIQDRWKNWGLRLDQESIYVARKFGWFESGWSRDFINECFKRNGLTLVLFDNGLGGGFIGVACKTPEKVSKIIANANALGFTPLCDGDIENSSRKYHSQIGVLSRNARGPFIRASIGHSGGFLCFGPYISLPAGRYSVSFLLRFLERSDDALNDSPSVVFDIVGDGGLVTYYKKIMTFASVDSTSLVNIEIEVISGASMVEARIQVPMRNEIWEMSLPIFEKVTPQEKKVH